MSNSTLWERSLEGVSYEKLTEFATVVPKMLSDVSIAGADEVMRDTGLLLTKKQVIDLRKYEAAGLALPYTLKDVTNYLSFGAGQNGGNGLRASDFLKTFTVTRDHAKRWSPLRERIMVTGTELKIFGQSMEIYGRSMEEVYKDLRSSALIEKYNIQTVAEFKKLQFDWVGSFPGLELDADTIPDMQHYLAKIFDQVKSNLANVRSIKADLDSFGYELREIVLPGIRLRVSLIKTNAYPAEIKLLDEVIGRRSIEIEEKNTQYKALVEKALGAAAGLNIFGLGMAIYYGVEAENVRGERKKLNDAQDKDIDVLQNKNQTLGSLKRVEHDLQNLTVIAVDAELATQNLMHVWNVMHIYVDQSATAIADIHDALSLRRFMVPFRLVVAPWVTIYNDADALIQVFKDADRDYGQQQTMAVPRMAAFSAFSAFFLDQAYPAFDLKALKDSHNNLRDHAIEAETLFIRLEYLPDVFASCKTLLGDIGACARELRDSSLNSKMDLESKVRRLTALEQERSGAVEGSQDLKEIEEDLAAALKALPAITRNEAKKLKSRLANISGAYAKNITHGYILGHERDQAVASAAKEKISAALAKCQEELRVVSAAISVIEKAGIEKVGKNVELTVDKIRELGMAPPEAQIIAYAIEQLKQTLADINEGISFMSMINETRTLQRKIHSLERKVFLEDKALSQSMGRVAFIHTVHAMDDQRKIFAGEYEKAVTAFTRYLAIADAHQSEDIAEAKIQANKFIAILAPCSVP
ncbi:alpha-xenorhabdolysin family binary toxin subunit A [Rhodococcus sp. IEGM1300]